jgi:hypothetical protein
MCVLSLSLALSLSSPSSSSSSSSSSLDTFQLVLTFEALIFHFFFVTYRIDLLQKIIRVYCC